MELKESIEILKNKIHNTSFAYTQDKQALQTAISHLETLQKVKEMGGVQEMGGVKRKELYENNYSNGWNDCLDAVHAELTGKLEGLEGVISEWLKSSEGKEHLTNKIQELILGKKEE